MNVPLEAKEEFECVRECVTKAIKQFIKEDSKLLEIDVHERSMTHKIAEYLRQEIDKVFPDENCKVDCEYNRRYDLEKNKQVSKTMSDGKNDKFIYPDIIVHVRGKLKNLLAIEAKKIPNPNSSERERDIKRLRRFTKDPRYCYDFGLLLTLIIKKTTWMIREDSWYHDGEEIPGLTAKTYGPLEGWD